MGIFTGKLICFTGIDGAGKTTLSNNLYQYLNAHGMHFHYVYGRFLPFLVKPLWSLGRRAFLEQKGPQSGSYSQNSVSKKKVLQNRLIGKIHESLVITDYFLQVLVKIGIPLVLGINLVCDRYVYDTIISDLAIDLGYSKAIILQRIDFCLKFLPRPGLVFCLDVPEEISMRRKGDVPDIRYLKDRRPLYTELRQRPGFVTIDGNLPLEVSNNKVIQSALEFIGLKK